MNDMVVTRSQIADAMRLHAISVATKTPEDTIIPTPRRRKYKPSQKTQANRKEYGKFIAGKQNQTCPYCKNKFVKAAKHAPHCFFNPKRIPGNAPVVEKDNSTAIVEMMMNLCGTDVVVNNIEMFTKWVDLTKSLLKSK